MLGLFVETNEAYGLKQLLKSSGFGAKESRVVKIQGPPGYGSGCLVPVKYEMLKFFEFLLESEGWKCYKSVSELFDRKEYWFCDLSFPAAKGLNCDLISKLDRAIQDEFASAPHIDFNKYELYEDFLILPENAFLGPEWCDWFSQNSPEHIFDLVSKNFGVSLISRKSKISATLLRSPKHPMLYYNKYLADNQFPSSQQEPIVSTIQNSVKYFWNPIRTMFSAGNISEKLRLASINCRGQVVVDLYAGIGYWAIPLMVHCNSDFIYACEMNPYSVEALKRNFRENNVDSSKFAILEGDHADFVGVYAGKADRVILGNLPSSENGWQFAIQALKSSGGILHVHHNVDCGKKDEFIKSMIESLTFLAYRFDRKWKIQVKNVFRVKSYGPKIDHFVFDVYLF